MYRRPYHGESQSTKKTLLDFFSIAESGKGLVAQTTQSKKVPVNPVNSYFMSTWQVTPPQNCPFYPRFLSRSNHLTNLMTKIGQRGWRI